MIVNRTSIPIVPPWCDTITTVRFRRILVALLALLGALEIAYVGAGLYMVAEYWRVSAPTGVVPSRLTSSLWRLQVAPA